MKGKGDVAVGRRIDVAKNTRLVGENLWALILFSMRGRQPMSKHEIIQEIFYKCGVSVNPDKMELLLNFIKEKRLIEEKKRGLVTVYSLTAQGMDAAKQVNIKELKTLL